MHSRTHTHSVHKQEWRNTDCVVVTMALVPDFSHPESIILLKAILTEFVQGKSLLVELFQRHFATCIIRSPLLHHHNWSLLFCHCIHRNLLHPLRGSHGVFLQTCSERDMRTPLFCPSPRRCCICLSHIVSDSDVCASVSVSCSRSCNLTSAGFCSCGVPPGSILLSSGLPHSRSAFLRMSHILHCCQKSFLPLLPFRSAPRSGRFASMSTRSLMIHPSTPAVLPAPATVHSLAVPPALALTQTPACFQAMLLARATTMLSPASV